MENSFFDAFIEGILEAVYKKFGFDAMKNVDIKILTQYIKRDVIGR